MKKIGFLFFPALLFACGGIVSDAMDEQNSQLTVRDADELLRSYIQETATRKLNENLINYDRKLKHLPARVDYSLGLTLLLPFYSQAVHVLEAISPETDQWGAPLDVVMQRALCLAGKPVFDSEGRQIVDCDSDPATATPTLLTSPDLLIRQFECLDSGIRNTLRLIRCRNAEGSIDHDCSIANAEINSEDWQAYWENCEKTYDSDEEMEQSCYPDLGPKMEVLRQRVIDLYNGWIHSFLDRSQLPHQHFTYPDGPEEVFVEIPKPGDQECNQAIGDVTRYNAEELWKELGQNSPDDPVFAIIREVIPLVRAIRQSAEAVVQRTHRDYAVLGVSEDWLSSREIFPCSRLLDGVGSLFAKPLEDSLLVEVEGIQYQDFYSAYLQNWQFPEEMTAGSETPEQLRRYEQWLLSNFQQLVQKAPAERDRFEELLLKVDDKIQKALENLWRATDCSYQELSSMQIPTGVFRSWDTREWKLQELAIYPELIADAIRAMGQAKNPYFEGPRYNQADICKVFGLASGLACSDDDSALRRIIRALDQRLDTTQKIELMLLIGSLATAGMGSGPAAATLLKVGVSLVRTEMIVGISFLASKALLAGMAVTEIIKTVEKDARIFATSVGSLYSPTAEGFDMYYRDLRDYLGQVASTSVLTVMTTLDLAALAMDIYHYPGKYRVLLGQSPGKLKYLGNNTWETTAGLRYGPDPKFGNRVQHVLKHAVDNPGRRLHGIFTAEPSEILALVDEAYLRAMNSGGKYILRVNGPAITYEVEMGRTIGYVGGIEGALQGYPTASKINLLVVDGNNVISAFPVP